MIRKGKVDGDEILGWHNSKHRLGSTISRLKPLSHILIGACQAYLFSVGVWRV